MARTYFKITSTARSTTTSTTASTKCTLTFTPGANKTYWIIAWATMDHSITSWPWQAQLWNATAGTLLVDQAETPFAASDQMAFGVYEAVRRRGLRVPDDISVVGFDDLPEDRWSSPPLTTVRQPLTEMGGLAARTVLRLAQGEEIESPRVELATELVVRDSTTAPR